MVRNDDGSYGPAVQVGFSLNFFGQTYNQVYVNNNGNITFDSNLGTYTPFGLGQGYQGQPIIAPFFADVDTRGEGSGVVGFGTEQDYNGYSAFGVTWPGVGYFGAHDDKLNTFQLVLTDRSDTGSGNFDIYFNYGSVQWETGDASGGRNGLGGVSAAAGYSNGTATPGTYYQLPGSLQNGALLDSNLATGLIHNTNNDVAGQYVFHVRNGQVIVPGEPEGPTGPPPPPPMAVTYSLSGVGSVAEGNTSATPFVFAISRSGDVGSNGVASWSVDVDADDLAAGQPSSGTISFAPGQTVGFVTLLVRADLVYETDDSLTFRVDNVEDAGMSFSPGLSTTSIILNDDLQNTFRILDPPMFREGMSGITPFVFNLARAGDLSQAATVTWTIEDRTTDALDFDAGQLRTGVANFAAGSATAQVVVNVAGDTLIEKDETFIFRLTQATVGTSSAAVTGVSAQATILDDDGRRTVLIGSPNTLVKSEGDTGATAFSFNVTRVGDLTKAVDLTYTVTAPLPGGVSASEIVSPLTGTVSFGIGSTDATITVLVAGDTTPEGNESFLVTLGGGEFNTLNLTGVVLNDDGVIGSAAPPAPSAPAESPDTSSFMQHLMGGSLWGDGGF